MPVNHIPLSRVEELSDSSLHSLFHCTASRSSLEKMMFLVNPKKVDMVVNSTLR